MSIHDVGISESPIATEKSFTLKCIAEWRLSLASPCVLLGLEPVAVAKLYKILKYKTHGDTILTLSTLEVPWFDIIRLSSATFAEVRFMNDNIRPY